jgi:hypothetical protein
MQNSKEYRQFNRHFIGPILPKKIAKERGIGIYFKESMPASKPERVDCKREIPFRSVGQGDWRNTSSAINLKYHVTPLWANKQAIKEQYTLAKTLTEQTGIKHHVDHIIPLRHPLVCGLHTETNLRVIPAWENIQKSNDFKV